MCVSKSKKGFVPSGKGGGEGVLSPVGAHIRLNFCGIFYNRNFNAFKFQVDGKKLK